MALSTKQGDLLVVSLTGMLGSYVAEITQADPLQLKVSDTGPLSKIKSGDFVIDIPVSVEVQRDDRGDTCNYIKHLHANSLPPLRSGLARFGVKAGICTLLPADS